ncbi:esterase [Oleomonas cavernae]|uniref:Esterase n=1 Tax=Oleomonas cavernae TaxID=2320859 RepID=A0A418WA20_9PROT|nr:PHB depolymerase family esterase [Oleomonas cavernae]RJF86887.1 esterase [Oleomonas cavernae]
MTIDLPPRGLLRVTRLTLAERLSETSALLRRLLKPGRQPGTAPAPDDLAGEAGQPLLPSALRGLYDRVSRGEFALPGADAPRPAPPQEMPAAGPAQFLAASFTNAAGSRPYKLYVPASYRGRPVPLVVMLHGCTQSPDDFAAGTRMNQAAEEHGFLVVYPGQTAGANPGKCWNWFSPGDQRRDNGEPSLIAGITRAVMDGYAVDAGRIFVAGLSAGGAAAAIMGATYPELYAAIGVHSGLACGAARDLPTALSAMRRGSEGRRPEGHAGKAPRAIIFHGDRDTTVHPTNGDAVVAQWTNGSALAVHVEEGRVPDGHHFRRSLHTAADGTTVLEQWVIHGAGHAWSGGSLAGTYTDPRGPDATREMLRFFLEKPSPQRRGWW